jgi:hypothetical protein
MADTYPYATQRAQLERFLKSIGARPSTLRKDDCGDPVILGSRGHVIAVPGLSWRRPSKPGWSLFVVTESGSAWTYAKRALKFADVVQDGAEEGILFMERLPTIEEAKAIRRYLGIPKKAQLSEDTLAIRRVALVSARARLKAA